MDNITIIIFTSFVFLLIGFSVNDAFAVADISYDAENHKASLTWDLGDRENCLMVTVTPKYFNNDFTNHATHSFFGTNLKEWNIINGTEGLSATEMNILVVGILEAHEPTAVIPCKGELTYNLSDFQLLNNFSGIDVKTFFYEMKDGDHIQVNTLVESVALSYTDDDDMFIYDCDSTSRPHNFIDIYYGNTQEIKRTKINGSCTDVQLSLGGHHEFIYSPLLSYSVLDYIPYDQRSPPIQNEKNGGDGNKHLTRPTFGISHSTFKGVVECGYSHNGVCHDITNNWYTPFEKIKIETGVPQEIIIKGYFPNGVKTIGWGLIPEIGEFHKSETKIQAYISHLDEVDHVDTYQKHNILNMTSINYEYYQEPCGYVTSICDVLKMSNVIFMVEPIFEKIAIYAVDDQNRSQLTFLNEGYDIFGDSLNEPLESRVSVGKGGAFYPQRVGSVDLILVDYKTDTWQDEYGYLWTGDNYKSFKIIYIIPVPVKAPDKLGTIIDRGHSEFYRITEYELKRALEIFDASILVNELPAAIEIIVDIPNVELDELKLEYKKQIEAYKAENYLLYSQPEHKKIFKQYQIDRDELNKKFNDSQSLILEKIESKK